MKGQGFLRTVIYIIAAVAVAALIIYAVYSRLGPLI